MKNIVIFEHNERLKNGTEYYYGTFTDNNFTPFEFTLIETNEVNKTIIWCEDKPKNSEYIEKSIIEAFNKEIAN